MNIRCGFSDIRHAASEKIERAAAVGRAIGIAGDNRCDGFEWHAKFFRRNLPVGGKYSARAEIRLADANQYGVIGMDFDPRLRQRRI